MQAKDNRALAKGRFAQDVPGLVTIRLSFAHRSRPTGSCDPLNDGSELYTFA